MTATERAMVLDAIAGTPDWKGLRSSLYDYCIGAFYFTKRDLRKYADKQFGLVEKKIQKLNFPIRLTKRNLALGNSAFYMQLKELYSNPIDGGMTIGEINASGIKKVLRIPNIVKIQHLPKSLKRVAMKALVYIKGEFVELD